MVVKYKIFVITNQDKKVVDRRWDISSRSKNDDPLLKNNTTTKTLKHPINELYLDFDRYNERLTKKAKQSAQLLYQKKNKNRSNYNKQSTIV